jgi:hypothetical protein
MGISAQYCETAWLSNYQAERLIFLSKTNPQKLCHSFWDFLCGDRNNLFIVMGPLAFSFFLLITAERNRLHPQPALLHDANGNMTNHAGDQLTYNGENHLTQASVGGVATTYAYDGDAQQVLVKHGDETTIYIGKHFEVRISPSIQPPTLPSPPVNPCLSGSVTCFYLPVTLSGVIDNCRSTGAARVEELLLCRDDESCHTCAGRSTPGRWKSILSAGRSPGQHERDAG